MKVAIIGGGICGLYLGWKLSETGHNVLVFEKESKSGNKVCSGLFSQRILNFIPLSAGLIQNRIKFALLHFPKKTIRIEFSKDFFVMPHSRLDELVASLVQKAGAKIIYNYRVSSMLKGFDRIIGCDGANSFVRRNFGLSDPKFRLGILGLAENSSLPAGRELFSANFVETWPVKNGFIWKIPRGNETEYGIIANPNEAKKLFDGFLEKNNISLKGIGSRIIPSSSRLLGKNLEKQVALCGDAIGLTKPWSGGGVIWGLTAAEILLKTFPDFSAYNRLMKKFFLPKIVFSKIATRVVYFCGHKAPWLLPAKVKIESDFLI